MKKLILIVSLLLMSVLIFAQTARTASDYAELLSALTASANGDIVNIMDDIVVTAQVILNKSITINGNGYEISVPRPGLDDMGRYNTTPSAFRVFFINGVTVTINDLGIKGGSTTGVDSQGGAVYIMSNAVLTLNRCIISNSRSEYGGGGIAVYGVLYMNGSYVRRNAARYGGGMLVSGSAAAAAYVESSSLIENRSTYSSGGGGGAEVNMGGKLYFNNSTLANNQSTEIGGAINCAQGNVFFINSSATGNVAFGSLNGGAIGNNGGQVYILNSLLAYNYRRSAGLSSNPTAYVLDDVVAHYAIYPESQSNVRIYYSIYHASLPNGMGADLSNVKYSGAMNGTDNTIFSGGILSKITDNNGNEIGVPIFRPFLYDNAGGVAPTLKTGSFVSNNRGTRTRFANNNNVNPAIAYYHDSAYANLLGSSSAGQEVTGDQINTSRANPPTRGAIEAETSTTLYIVKVNGATGGTVNGGTIYGDVYPSGTSVTLTAIPYAGYSFVGWNYVAGGSGTASTASPYTFNVSSNVTLIPVFQAAVAGNYSITYIGNENTGGTPPATQTFSAATTIANAGTLVRAGYTFVEWNTNSNGSGTAYAIGSSYSAGVNLTLYAQWELSAALVVTPSEIATIINGIQMPEGLVETDPTVNPYIATYPIAGIKTVSIEVGAGEWRGYIYYSGSWHNADVFPVFGPGTVVFSDVPFAGGKESLPIILKSEDETLPVELSSFTAVYNASMYVTLAWVAESETDHAGYNVLRNSESDLSYAYKVNSSIINEGSNMGSQISYSYSDTDIYMGESYYYWLESVSNSGIIQYFGPIHVSITTDEDVNPPIPVQNILLSAYPNPFNPSTTLRYGIDKAAKVSIEIYNVRGQKVKNFAWDHSDAGFYSLIWDGTDNEGKALSSGMYFYIMKTKDFSASRKVILSK